MKNDWELKKDYEEMNSLIKEALRLINEAENIADKRKWSFSLRLNNLTPTYNGKGTEHWMQSDTCSFNEEREREQGEWTIEYKVTFE